MALNDEDKFEFLYEDDERRDMLHKQESMGRFLKLLPGMFAFPFRGRGKIMMIVAAFMIFMVQLVSMVSMTGGLLSLGLLAYFLAYAPCVIRSVAGGDNEPPTWPEIDMATIILLASFIMACIVGSVVWGADAAMKEGSSASEDRNPLVLACVLAVVLTLPMTMLSLAMHRNLSGLNPVRVVISILRVLPGYVLACISLVVGFMLAGLLFYLTAFMPTPLLAFTGSIAVFLIILYFIMMEMYILGILYRTHERKLDWF